MVGRTLGSREQARAPSGASGSTLCKPFSGLLALPALPAAAGCRSWRGGSGRRATKTRTSTESIAGQLRYVFGPRMCPAGWQRSPWGVRLPPVWRVNCPHNHPVFPTCL